MFDLQNTIVAIATPLGVGGIGILRLSGEEAFPIAQRVFLPGKPLDRRRQVLFGKFKNPQNGEILDEGLLLVMPKPHSYTTEDVVEFHVHGSPSLLEQFLQILVGLGARPAQAGEFTYRAFVHGRLDLAQAEAVEALVSSQGQAAQRQAARQLTGGLAAHLEPLEEALKSLYLKVEARLEFSEDGIPPLDLEKFLKEAQGVQKELQKLSDSYRQGKVLREGLTVALVGPPNVGKSSLLNAILGAPRAIVTPHAGTTRDLVEGEIRLKGVKVRLFDTAGLRETAQEVEAEGIRRSRQVLQEADLLFWVVDASDPMPSLEEWKRSGLAPDRVLFLLNKSDLAGASKGLPIPEGKALRLSCLTGEGLPGVFQQIEKLLQEPLSGEDVVLTSARHQEEVQRGLKALGNLFKLIEGKEPYELWAEELKEAALSLGRIRGRNLPASAFEDIFTKFCIGK